MLKKLWERILEIFPSDEKEKSDEEKFENLDEEDKRKQPLNCQGFSLNSDINIGKSDFKKYE